MSDLPGDPPAKATVSPLDVLLTAMQRKWEAGDLDAAASLARAAAPYLHPRHAPTRDSARSPGAPERLTDAELDRLLDDDAGPGTGARSAGDECPAGAGGAGPP